MQICSAIQLTMDSATQPKFTADELRKWFRGKPEWFDETYTDVVALRMKDVLVTRIGNAVIVPSTLAGLVAALRSMMGRCMLVRHVSTALTVV